MPAFHLLEVTIANAASVGGISLWSAPSVWKLITTQSPLKKDTCKRLFWIGIFLVFFGALLSLNVAVLSASSYSFDFFGRPVAELGVLRSWIGIVLNST